MAQFWHDLFVSLGYLCSFNNNTMSNITPVYFKCCLYLTGCQMWWMRVWMNEWMNYQLFFYVINVTSEWLYEWLCDWDLFQQCIFNCLILMWCLSFRKSFRKKPASHPLLARWKSRWWECSWTHKKAGVCTIMFIWLVHIKENVWTIGTCPTTILLSTVTMYECVCVNGSTEGNCKEDLCSLWLAHLYAPQRVIWERVAPSHTGMTQLSDWPELH